MDENLGLPNSGVYSLKWNNFQTHLSKEFNKLLEDDDFTDVTLACSGNCLRSHKVILSLCSQFFKRIFKSNRSGNSNTVVILNNVRFEDLQNIISFIYNGQVNIKHTELNSFLQAAELLQIEGLAGSYDESQSQPDDNNISSAPLKSSFNSPNSFSSRQESLDTMPSKRPKLNSQSSSVSNQQQSLSSGQGQSYDPEFVNVSPSVEIIPKTEETDDIEIIDPLQDIHDQEMPEKNIGIYSEEKEEEEQPIFLERMPSASAIRIEGIFSTSSSSSSKTHVPSTSSAGSQKQDTIGTRYSAKKNSALSKWKQKAKYRACRHCGGLFYKTNLARHVNTAHAQILLAEGKKLFNCGICQNVYRTVAHLEAHVLTHAKR